jgi:hypothetical protein
LQKRNLRNRQTIFAKNKLQTHAAALIDISMKVDDNSCQQEREDFFICQG